MNHSTVLNLTAADAALGRGDWQTAITAYRAALSDDNTIAVAWFNLAYALRAVRDFEAALAAYRQAIAHGIDGPDEALVNCAAILSEHMAAPAAAEGELRTAILINPRSVPALLNLAMLMEDSGDGASARSLYDQVLALAPGNGRALLRKTMIAIHDGSVSKEIPALQSALLQPGLSPDERADIGFALANAFDDVGQHIQAWTAVLAANADDIAACPPTMRYDRVKHARLVDALIAAPLPPINDTGAETVPEIIFICGLFRSGSTLAEQILARHPAITAGGELELVPALIADHIPAYPASLGDADARTLALWRQYYLSGIEKLVGDARIITDKRCDNFLHIGLIKSLFPNAKIVHTVRNPDDVLISTLFLRFGHAVNYGASPNDFAHWYGEYRRLMNHWDAHFGADIITFDYDQLVARPEDSIRTLLARLGLSWEDACLGHHEDTAVRVTTASGWQVRQPVHQRSSGRARAYAGQLSECVGSLTGWKINPVR